MYPTEIGVTFSAGASISERPDGTYYGRFHFTPSDYYDGPAKIQGGSVEIVDRNIQNSSISSYCFYHDHYPPEAGPFPYTTNLVVYASFNVSEDTKLNIKISRELVSGEICREYLEQDGVFGVFDRMPLGTGFWEGSRNDFDISLNEGSNPLVDLQD